MHPSFAILALGMPGPIEMLVIVVVALLIFGRRLPDLARSAGKSIVEFKKGLNDIKDDVDRSSREDTERLSSSQKRSLPSSDAGKRAPAGSTSRDAEVGAESSD